MQHKSKIFGNKAENIAEMYLRRKRYKIIKKNWKTRFGEVDIIAKFKDVYVFIEVKSLSGVGDLRPEDHLTHNKIGKLSKLADFYMNAFVLPIEHNAKYQIDVISLTLINSRKYILRHLECV